MRDTLTRPPRTIMEVYKSLPEGTLAELIDNIIYMSPSPAYQHQKVLQTIFRHLSEAITDQGKGEVIVAPFDVYLDEHSNAVQPDIIVVLNESRTIINEKGHIHGVPDLLIEILSPGNKDHDLIIKKDLYERFGVKEYWVVDPENRRVIGYALRGKVYDRIGEETGLMRSPILNVEVRF